METQRREVGRVHDPATRGSLLADVNQIEWLALGEGVKFGRHRHITPTEFFIIAGGDGE